jgi:hypothetical protein
MRNIIICLIIMGCESPTQSNTYQIDPSRNVSRTRDCSLEIRPNLPLSPSGEYICYVPYGHFDFVEIPIHYMGPERSEVTWTITWLQAGVSQVVDPTYPGPECRDEIQLVVSDTFINDAATLFATTGTSADAVVLVVRRQPPFSSTLGNQL